MASSIELFNGQCMSLWCQLNVNRIQERQFGDGLFHEAIRQ